MSQRFINNLLLQHFHNINFDRVSDQSPLHHLSQALTMQRNDQKNAEMIVLKIEQYGIFWKFERNNEVKKKNCQL